MRSLLMLLRVCGSFGLDRLTLDTNLCDVGARRANLDAICDFDFDFVIVDYLVTLPTMPPPRTT